MEVEETKFHAKSMSMQPGTLGSIPALSLLPMERDEIAGNYLMWISAVILRKSTNMESSSSTSFTLSKLSRQRLYGLHGPDA
jgi:hypothetical protein